MSKDETIGEAADFGLEVFSRFWKSGRGGDVVRLDKRIYQTIAWARNGVVRAEHYKQSRISSHVPFDFPYYLPGQEASGIPWRLAHVKKA